MGSAWGPGWEDASGGDLPTVDAADAELELVGAAVRRALVQPIAPALADAHVREMVAAHAGGPGRVPRPRRHHTLGQAWRSRLAPLLSAAAAAGIAAAAVAGSLPAPVQGALATAAAHVGISLRGRDDHRTTRVSTPTPPTRPPHAPITVLPPPTITLTPTSAPRATAPAPSAPTTAASAPSSVPVTTLTPTSAATEPATTAPPTTVARVGPTTTASPPTSTSPRAGCANPGIVSATATLQPGGTSVSVVITTSGTVPYMSATIDGMSGVVADLQPTPSGFAGTVTAPTTIPVGALLVFGACGVRGSATIQA